MTARRSPPRRRAPERRAHRSSPRAGGDGAGAACWLYGRHAVAAALANPARRWHQLLLLPGHEKEAEALLVGASAPRAGEAPLVRVLSPREFAAMLPRDAVHQGVALAVEPLPEPSLDEVLDAAPCGVERCVVLVLDGVEDPQNVGAVLRSAAAFGARAVVVGAQRAPPAGGALAKAASGALEILPLVRAVNLARALDRLKAAGFWVFGLEESAIRLFCAEDQSRKIALVLGSEGRGLRRLVRERCDFLARLPTHAGLPTLNVSNAAAVALYELMRPRGEGGG